MTARICRLVGAALVWTVMAVVAAAAFAVCLPLLVVAALFRGVAEVGRVLFRRGEMSGVDDLDEVLRARIDGDDTAVLDCGCPPPLAVYGCPHCGWRSCSQHRGSAHLCERTPLFDWQHEWPTGRIKPTNLDDSAAEPNELLNEIYQYLESAQ